MTKSETTSRQLEVPFNLANLSWPSWRWLDDMFHDNEMHQMIKVEECREGDSMVIRAEVPGVDPDKDIRVEMIDGALVISAEKTERHENTDTHVHRSEFRYGSLTRSVPVPQGVDETQVTATYTDGVLEVRFPMPTESAGVGSRRIEVTRG